MQHRTKTNSFIKFLNSGNNQFTADANIYLNADEAGTGGSLIRLNSIKTTLGKANTNAILTTQGTGDLTLSTNDGTNSGTIVIADGANGNISLTPNGTGNVALGNFTFNADQTVGSGQDNYVLTYDNSAGTIGLEAAAGGGSPGGSDTQVQYNNGGSFGGIAGFTFTDTSGSEQFLFSDTSDTALVKIVQEGTGAAFQVHDAGSDTSIFQVNQIGTVAIGFNTSGGGGYGKLQVAGTNYSYTHGAEAGSAGSPSFQFVGDQNTGMFSGGTDILGFSTGGTERLAIGAAGEILIGGTAAGNDGQVLTSGGSGAAVTWEDAGGSPAGSDTFIQYNNGGSFGATTLSYDDTADAEQYKIDVSSSVAPFVIVQTGTGNAFEVHDDTDPDNNRFEIDQYGRVAVQGQAGTNSAALYAGGVIASASRIRSAAGSASNLAFSTTGDTNTGMYFPAADNLGFSTGGTERFRFGSSGEILIGGSAAGTSGQVLTSGGSGAAVTWAT